LEDVICSATDNVDQQRIFTAVNSSFYKVFKKQKETHIWKFLKLINQQKPVSSTDFSDTKKFVLNLSKHTLSKAEETVLRKGLNFAVRKPHSNLDIACAVESVFPKLPRPLGLEFRWRIRSMLEKTRPPPTNIKKQEISAIKSLRLNKEIRILRADKGNCTVVLNESDYNNKLNSLLQSDIYEILPKDPTLRIERRIQKLLAKSKTSLPSLVKHRLKPLP
jgi:hypothetical protein